MSKLITAEQLNTIHRLQTTAMDNGDLATYWALSVAVDFALHMPVDEDLARVERNLRSRP
jgi:hypothetical protein